MVLKLDTEENDGGWKEWRQHVLLEIKRLNNNLEKLEEKSAIYALNTSIEISKLKVWSIIFGGVAGTLATLVVREVLTRW